jgi:hypothetical protein
MIKLKDGGPAFPLAEPGNCVSASEGMSLRDYFAAKAMPAMYRDFWDDFRAGRNGCVPEDWRMGIALDAYAIADAMLAAREG